MRRAATSPPAGPAPDLDRWQGRSVSDLAAECDAIRERRGLPDPVLHCLLDDIAAAGGRVDTGSCAARHRNRLPVCGTCSWCLRGPERTARQLAYLREYRDRQKELTS